MSERGGGREGGRTGDEVETSNLARDGSFVNDERGDEEVDDLIRRVSAC